MASTASDLLQVRLQGTGDNSNTWGTLLNTALSRMEESIADITNIAVTAANYTLDDTQYVEHDDATPTAESHVAAVKVTGTLTGNRTVFVPARNKMYWIWNATGGSYTLTIDVVGGGGSGYVVPQGYLQAVICDGTNVECLSPAISAAGVVNLNGLELILDADGDTTFHADTDDQLDLRIAGADDFSWKANDYDVLAGSKISISGDGSAIDAANSIGFGVGMDGALYSDGTNLIIDATTQTDFAISGTVDMSFAANKLTITAGSEVVVAGDGTAIGAAGAISWGVGEDGAIYSDGDNLHIDVATQLEIEVAGTEVGHWDAGGINLVTGDQYEINEAAVLTATTLGAGVVNSSLTGLGTLTTLTIDDITINTNAITSAGASSMTIVPTSGQSLILDGALDIDGAVMGYTGAFTVTGSALIDGITIDAATIIGTTAASLEITPTAGQSLILDGALDIDGAVMGYTGVATVTGSVVVDTMTIDGGSITDSSAAISFGDENLSTTGTLASGAITTTGVFTQTLGGSRTSTGGDESLILTNSASSGDDAVIAMTSADDGFSALYFGKASDGIRGFIKFTTSTDTMTLAAGDGYTNLTLAGTSGSELATFTHNVTIGSTGSGATRTLTLANADANVSKILWASASDGAGAQITWQDTSALMLIGTAQVDHSVTLAADNNIPNLTLAGADGSETATFAGIVGIGQAAATYPLRVTGAITTDGDVSSTVLLRSTDSAGAGVGPGIGFGGMITDTSSAVDHWAGIVGSKSSAVAGEYGGQLEMVTRVHGGALTTRMLITDAGAVTIGGTLTAGATTITGGSLASSTGTIDIGTDTLRLHDEILFDSATTGVIRNNGNGSSNTITGGSASNAGGNITLYGGTHATLANDFQFRGGSTVQLYYDDSASSFDFQANALTTTGALAAGATTLSSGSALNLSSTTSSSQSNLITFTGTYAANGHFQGMQWLNSNGGTTELAVIEAMSSGNFGGGLQFSTHTGAGAGSGTTSVALLLDENQDATFAGEILYDTTKRVDNAAALSIDMADAPDHFGTSFADIDATNMAFTLPTAGTYLILADMRMIHDGDASAWSAVQLYNQSDTAAISNTIRMALEITETTQGLVNATIHCHWIVTFDSADEVRLQGKASVANTVGTFQDANGYSAFSYVRLY